MVTSKSSLTVVRILKFVSFLSFKFLCFCIIYVSNFYILSVCYRSYAGVCSRLQDLVDGLRNVHIDESVSQKDALIQKAFASIQAVKHVS